MIDEDDFSNVVWPEYTEEDYQYIDHLCQVYSPNSNHGAPSISIGVDDAADGSQKPKDRSPTVDESPYALFREHKGYLSVTDIVAPAWCEVQFDYGLHQLRNKPLSERPISFFTKKGKEIHVEENVAVLNDRVLEKGKTVHKDLEREIHKEELAIQPKTKEETWALRLLDFLTRLKLGRETLVSRELPVWSVIHGHAIYGIIDELHLESCEAINSSKQAMAESKTHAQDSQVQSNLDSFILNARNVGHTTPTNSSFMLHIIDNKTRRSPSVPSHIDTLPSRLQLMLYRLMLIQALDISSDTSSFGMFCAHAGADTSQPFTETFIAGMSAHVVEKGLSLHFLDAKCLEDLDLPYRESLKEIGLDSEGCVSSRLSLVYRMRRSSVKRFKESVTSDTSTNLLCEQFVPPVFKEISPGLRILVDDLNTKIDPHMNGSVDVVKAKEENGSHDIPEALRNSINTDISGASEVHRNSSTSVGAPAKRKRRGSRKPSSTSLPVESMTDESSDSGDDVTDTLADYVTRSRPVVGTKKFQYNAKLLDAHILSVLAWWHGKRPPRGVSLEDTRRCNSCEYRNGCEWREQKALDLFEKASAKEALDLKVFG